MAEDLRRYDDNGYIILDKDFHTHTVYSHGKGTVRQNVLRAKAIGLKEIAITDHGTGHLIFGVSRKHLKQQKEEIIELRREIDGINILFGVESDLMGMSGKIDIREDDFDMFDIVLCGYHKPVLGEKMSDYWKLHYNAYSHFIYKPTAKQIANNTEAYIKMIEKNPIDIVTHPNYHLKVDCYEVAKACEEYGTAMELSSRHLDMDDKDYEDILKTNCMLSINSDAHKLNNIGLVSLAKRQVKKYNIPADRIINAVGTSYTLRSHKNK